MASRADIEAGGAMVRLFLKDDLSKALASTMRNAGEALQSTGKAVAAAGAGIAAAGAGILAPIIAGVNTFMELGSAATDAAGRTGLSVAALSELGFAAGQTGASIDDVEIGIKKMASLMLDAEQGTKTALDTFDSLGLKFTDLKGLSPEDQFSTLAKAIADIQDPSRRAAMAVEVFGRSGTQLLPMIDDLEALRSKARELGIVMSEEDAAAADELGDAWDSLKMQGTALLFQIGAAVAGPLQEFATQAKDVASGVIAWVKENKTLIQTVAAIGGGLVIAGTIIGGIGTAIWAIGGALTGAASILTFVGGIVSAIASPFGILTAAVIAGTLAWVQFTESGQATWQGFIATVLPLIETVKAAIGGIATAIMDSQWGEAGAIAMAGLEIALAEGTEVLKALFGETIGTIGGQIMSGDFAGAWSNVVNEMGLVWATFAEGVVGVFTGAADAVLGIADSLINAWAGIADKITESIIWLSGEGRKLEGMQEKNDQRAFEGKRQSILLMQEQLDAAQAVEPAKRDYVKINDLNKRLETARAEFGAGNYGAAQAGDVYGDSRKIARENMAGSLSGIRDVIQRAKDGAAAMRNQSAARTTEAAGTAVGGIGAAGAGIGEAGAAARAKLDDLLAQQTDRQAESDLMAWFDQRDAEDAGVAGGPEAPGAPSTAIPSGVGGNLTTYNAQAAQLAGFTGGGTPQEKMAANVYEMSKTLKELGVLSREQSATNQQVVTMYERFLASFQYG